MSKADDKRYADLFDLARTTLYRVERSQMGAEYPEGAKLHDPSRSDPAPEK
jgi:hypothetical protein